MPFTMLQTRIAEKSLPAIIFLTVIAIGLATALYMYFIVDKYSLIYYWDSVSHLVASRKFADWSQSPGLDQIGTVWMPLQHFLLFPFALVDFLFTTGFAGLSLSLPCLALTSVFLYKIIKNLKISNHEGEEVLIPSFVGLAGALLYATNPNILYLGITSMTEAPFMLFLVASAYYFQKWYQDGNSLRDLILCSIFLSFATLCRYESWFLPIFLIVIVFLFLVVAVCRPRRLSSSSTTTFFWTKGKGKKNDPKQGILRLTVLAVLASTISLSGIVFWLVWNQYHYGDAFEFSKAQYYSASWYAQNRPFREILFLQPANVFAVYGISALAMYGPFLLGSAAYAGYHFLRKSSFRRKNMLFLLFLVLPAAFTIISLLIGIGELGYWFNSRFMTLISPLVIVMASAYLVHIDGKYNKKRRAMLAIVVLGLFAYQLSTPAFSAVITLNDAKGGYSVKENLLAIKTGEALKSLYDGKGSIMILTGSGLEHRIMITSGIQLRHFDEIIESSTWKDSFKQPWAYDRWIVITNHPGSDAIDTTSYWLARQDELSIHYTTVYQDEYYKIMVQRERS